MSQYVETLYEQFIYKSRYSRYLHEENRREEYPETVGRYMGFMAGHLKKNLGVILDDQTHQEVKSAIRGLDVMPSMRALAAAGRALELENLCGYNCCYLPINRTNSFSELLYILMCGAGAGFSVERQFIGKLPEVPEELIQNDNVVIIVPDSKYGWAQSFDRLITCLYDGIIPSIDVSGVRKKGERLKTFGGRASGPAPLLELFTFVVEIFKKAAGRRLESIECHDICCMVGMIVVVGGVRRSSEISLSNLSDLRMRDAKAGAWYEIQKWRSMANNSVAYTEKPEVGAFMQEWMSTYLSKSGERGYFSRAGAKRKIASLPFSTRDPNWEFGLNPCGEIILRPYGLCNLSEVVLRFNDTPETFYKKVKIAAVLGTWQASLTDFKFVNREWSDNAKDESLLGISITGICDNEFFRTPSPELREVLMQGRLLAHTTNGEWAPRLGLRRTAAATTIKPSGTVGERVNAANGIHRRHANYVLRAVRQDNKDPVTEFMKDMGVPWEPERNSPDTTTVFYFPKESPIKGYTTQENNAFEDFALAMFYQQHWCDHNVSCTINLNEQDWPRMGGMVYDHFDQMIALSFLPKSDHVYVQAPLAAITEEQYREASAKMPSSIDWTRLAEYEKEDTTIASQEVACIAGNCEVR